MRPIPQAVSLCTHALKCTRRSSRFLPHDVKRVFADVRVFLGSTTVPTLSSGGRASVARTRPRALRNRPPKKSIRKLSSSWDNTPSPPPPPIPGGETRGQQARSAGDGADQDGLVRITSYQWHHFACSTSSCLFAVVLLLTWFGDPWLTQASSAQTPHVGNAIQLIAHRITTCT